MNDTGQAADDHVPPPGEKNPAFSSLSGTAGNAVVAGAIGGGIHFHSSGNAQQRPRQLPRPIGLFVNRFQDLKKLDQASAVSQNGEFPHSIVLITGTAGVGKTSLAVRWAHENVDHFPDGQLYLNMRGFDPEAPVDPLDALTHILSSLGLPPTAIPADLDAAAAQFRTQLADRRMLLVLDNVATARQVFPLLPGNSRCLTLITSRNSIPRLVSQEGARRVELPLFSLTDSARLLSEIFSHARGEDSVQNINELAELCARLPLALRVAAERAIEHPDESLRELTQDLKNESALWDSLSTDDSEQAESIRAVFTWSYRALALSAARMFRMLGLHPGQEIPTGAAAALAGVRPSAARVELDRLVSAHMIERVGPDRYQFHDLLRAYAVNQASSDPEDERAAAVNREAAWYTHSAAAAAVRTGGFLPVASPDPVPPGCEPMTFASRDGAVAWYEAESTNLYAIADVAARYGMRRWTWQIAISSHGIHTNTLRPFRDWLIAADHGLKAARADGEDAAVATILNGRAVAFDRLRRNDEAASDLNEALEIWRALEDTVGEVRALNSLGGTALRRHRLTEAMSYYNQVQDLGRRLPDTPWAAIGLENASVVYRAFGDLETAAALGEQAQEAFDDMARTGRVQVDRQQFDNLTGIARIQRERGLIDEAAGVVSRMEAIAEAVGSPPGFVLITLLERGHIQIASGDAQGALVTFLDALRGFRSEGDSVGEVTALNAIGDAHKALGNLGEATDFYRASASVSRTYAPWEAAVTLTKLGQCLAVSGEITAAQRERQSALELVAEYDDPRCAALRRQLTAEIGA